MGDCKHEARFGGVFGARNGCLACELEAAWRRLREVERYARLHAHPGVNTGEHAALNRILQIIGGEEVVADA